jgi:hypothetical protein
MNVAAHNAAVGVVACALSGQDPVITQAALIHDAFKRREWEIMQEAKEHGADLVKANRRAELASTDFLRDIGFDHETVQIASTTGDLGLERIIAAEATLPGKIVFYADNCVSGERIVGYTRRFDDMLREFLPGGRYGFKNEQYQQKFGRTHRQVWDSVVIPLEQELARHLGFMGNPTELYRLAFLPVEPRCR